MATWSVLPVLHVGVVGHRTLPDADAIGEAIADVLRTIAEAARGAVCEAKSAHAPALRCVSALAEGADRLVAEKAGGLGFALQAILPLPRPEYEHDFKSAAGRAEFNALLERATSVLELDGTRGDREQAYLDAGRVVLEQSDVLLAVWDGRPARGIGGTGAMVREAQERGIAVIVIASGDPRQIRTLGRLGDWREAIGAEVKRLLAPSGALPSTEVKDSAWARWVCSAYERLVLAGTDLDERLRRPAPATEAGSVFARADQLAIAYRDRYRAASILKVTAPILSVVGVFIGFYGRRLFLPGWSEAFGFALQVLTLGGVLWLFHINSRRAWHARFCDFRYIAEQLRFAEMFARLGCLPPLPRPAAFQSGSASDWASVYLRAVLRGPGLSSGRLTPDTVRAIQAEGKAQIEQQIAFYESRANRFTIMARRLNSLADACYWAGLGIVVLRAAIYVGSPADSSPRTLANEVAEVIPALAPIFLGLRAQGEYARLSQRYRAMAGELRATAAELGAAGPSSRGVDALLRRAVGLMLAEVADWRVLIGGRSISRL